MEDTISDLTTSAVQEASPVTVPTVVESGLVITITNTVQTDPVSTIVTPNTLYQL